MTDSSGRVLSCRALWDRDVVSFSDRWEGCDLWGLYFGRAQPFLTSPFTLNPTYFRNEKVLLTFPYTDT